MSDKYQYLLAERGNSVSVLFLLPHTFNEYGCGIFQIAGNVMRKSGGKEAERKMKKAFTVLYLCCNIVEQSYLGSEISLPILRKVEPVE